MEINIVEPAVDFDFKQLHLGSPTTLSGGSYFTRIFLNSKPLCIQAPKSLTKNGFVKSGKKIYADLMFSNNDSIFVQWVENLEEKCQELIFNKKDQWFQNQLEKDDIESAFTSPLKVYKSGKFYLLRTNVKQNIKIYNENDELLNVEDIKDNTNVVCIIEIQGIKFTAKNFQIEFEVKQSMVVSPDPFLDNCFIKKPSKTNNNNVINTTQDIKEFINTTVEEIKEKESAPIDIALASIISPNIDSSINNMSTINSSTINSSTIDSSTINSSAIDTPILTEDLDEITRKNTEANSGPPLDKGITILGDDSDENICLEIEELDKKDDEPLLEFDISNDLDVSSETMTLKNPNQVYYDKYKAAKEKAKESKRAAIIAYLEAQNIKKTYMLDDIDDTDSDGSGSSNEDEDYTNPGFLEEIEEL